MTLNRRRFIQSSAQASVAVSLPLGAGCAHPHSTTTRTPNLIIDTHQHLWDLQQIRPPWLASAEPILRQRYSHEEYAAATAGLNVRTVYMEVDVAPADHPLEADNVLAHCRKPGSHMVGATLGGRPDSPSFADYVQRYAGTGYIKGVRQVLHGPSTPKGHGLRPEFVRGVQLLGKHRLNFELTLRPTELLDGVKMTEQCPETSFVLDHCGNGDPKAFFPKLVPEQKRFCTVDEWKRGIDAFARRPNVVCKISGVIAFLPPGQASAEHLAPVVNYCLDAFGPERVFFGGDWPVCLLGSPLRGWIDALSNIVATRPAGDRVKLWSGNAARFYRLTV